MVGQYLGGGDSLQNSRQPRVDPGVERTGLRTVAATGSGCLHMRSMRSCGQPSQRLALSLSPKLHVWVWRRVSVAALSFIDFGSLPVANVLHSS